MRIILIPVAIIVGQRGWLSRPLQCAVIEYLGGLNPDRTKTLYPNCSSYLAGDEPGQEILVRANWDFDDLPGTAVSLRFGYLFGGWVAFTLHAIGVEIYVSERLFYFRPLHFANGCLVAPNAPQPEAEEYIKNKG